MSAWAGAQPAYAIFHLGQLEVFKTYYFDIMITQNDHPRYIKHVLGRIYVFFTQFRYWAPGGGGVS